MHRKDLNIKNKVPINTKSYLNNWNKLALHFRISHTKSILINVLYVYCKNGKKFYNLFICETIFQAFRHAFFIFGSSSLLANSHIFEISEMTTHTERLTIIHARGHWWTLDFANAFVSPGVNSRGELVPSHGATRRGLGDYYYYYYYLKIFIHGNFSAIYTSI
jgi:presenilin-like A22 family membrane protease